MIDFLASQKHYIDHIAPVWNRIPVELRHDFYVPNNIISYAQSKLVGHGMYLFGYGERVFPQNDYPILVCAYGDLIAAQRNNPARKIIYMEHGTGHAFGTAAYPNGVGKRDYASLFLAPNEYTRKLIQSVRNTRVEVIGTPKMDIYEGVFDITQRMIQLIGTPSPPVIAIAFHWGDRHSVPPESGSAWEYYKDILPELNKRYKIIAHGHPLAQHIYKREFERLGIEWVGSFDNILTRADIYINDLSSTLYEFACTGKPVIILNAPWFRRDMQWGIRFWDYSDIGLNVNEPEELFSAIDTTIQEYVSIRLEERRQMVEELYPYIGKSAERAARIITEYINV
jgi:hypothetical protein